jgi:hypothetical protein
LWRANFGVVWKENFESWMFGRRFYGCMIAPHRRPVEKKADSVIFSVVFLMEVWMELNKCFGF